MYIIDFQILTLSIIPLCVGYVLGSIPFGMIFTWLATRKDIRGHGSGNIGTTNALRIAGKKTALLTVLCDSLKATAAMVITFITMETSADSVSNNLPIFMAAIGAMIGHMFPVWLKFKGGKGIATFVGILIVLAWPVAVIFALIWIYCAVLTRLSSFAGLTASLSVPFIFHIIDQPQLTIFTAILVILIWIKHHGNIQRLMAGTEQSIRNKNSAQQKQDVTGE